MPEVQLHGCRPQPLMSYLKALGVFRIVAEQRDSSARAAWVNDRLVLRSELEERKLIAYLLESYKPSPVMAPWAGGSGFFGKDSREALTLIGSSETPRLSVYREAIAEVKRILKDEGQYEKPSEKEKSALLRRYRRELPDDYLHWMDTVLVNCNNEAIQVILGFIPPKLGIFPEPLENPSGNLKILLGWR